MLFNVPALEETLSSYIIRQLFVSGTIDIKRKTRCFFLSSESNHWKIFPWSTYESGKILQKLSDRYSVDKILNDHTLLPLYRAVNSHHFKRSLARSLREHPHQEKILLAHTGEPTAIEIKFCTLCFQDQISKYGFTWFKREWKIHGMEKCQEHGCDIIKAYCDCGNKNSLTLALSSLQGVCQKCGSNFWNVSNRNEREPYAHWLSNLLKFDIHIIDIRLREFLIIKAYQKVSGRKLYNINQDKDKIGDFFYNFHKYFSEKYYRPSERFDFSRIVRDKISSSERFHLDCLYFPLFLAFPNFDDFLTYLRSISSSCKVIYQNGFYEKLILNNNLIDIRH